MGGSSSSPDTTSAMAKEPERISEADQVVLHGMERKKDAIAARSFAWDGKLANLKKMKDSISPSSSDCIEAIRDIEIELGEEQVAGMKDFVASVQGIDKMVTGLQEHEEELVADLGQDFFNRVFECSQETKGNLLETQLLVIGMKRANSKKLMAIEMLKEEGGEQREQVKLAKIVFGDAKRWDETSREVGALQRQWKKTERTAKLLNKELEAKVKEMEELRKKPKSSFWGTLLSGVAVVAGVALIAVSVFVGAAVSGPVGFCLGICGILALVAGIAGLGGKQARRVADKIVKESMEYMKAALKKMSDIAKLCYQLMARLFAAIAGMLVETMDEGSADAMLLRACRNEETLALMEEHCKKIDTELRELHSQLTTMMT